MLPLLRRGRLSFLNVKAHLASEGRAPMPKWLLKPGNSTSQRYWRKIWQATPPWLNEDQINEMKVIYANTPIDCHVDHVVPLKSELVSGLHVPWNLAVIPEKENLAKSNKWWPNHPFEQLRLF